MPERHETLRHCLALIRAPHVGPATFHSLLERFGSPEAVLAASRQALAEAGLKPASLDYLQAPGWSAVDADLRWQDAERNHILLWDDAAYPALLREIADPPPLLYVVGDAEVLNRKQLAMVGSRNPTPAGRETAREFAAHLARQGIVICSGLALGIDGASHEGALDGEGLTVAVTGTGLDRVYPARHRELAHRIAENGALVSEFPPGTPPVPANFPRRNRLISGMSMGVLVIEAALRSGSLITARLAAEQGREVFAVPGSIHNPQARGCNALIRQGAKLVETARHIFEELGGFAPPWPAAVAPTDPETAGSTDSAGLDPDYKKVLESVGFDPTSVDHVVERSGLTADAVCSMLLVLELQGLITATSSGHYCQTC
jgi:DNA processing protein